MLFEKGGIKGVFHKKIGGEYPKLFTREKARTVRNFHKTMDNYKETPLVSLDNLAEELGLGKIFIKDESHRFGLNAFKALGGVYAIAKLICEKLGVDIKEVDFDYLKSSQVRKKIGEVTFATATDGNHGKGVAWAANQLGQRAVVYLPKGAAKSRVDAIIKEGAQAHVTNLNYDDAVRLAFSEAKANGWYVVQDTSMEDYEVIPGWIMEGYMTMADEALEQMEALGFDNPSHIFLQAGVGGMAGAVLGYLANRFKEDLGKTIIMEADTSACIYKSALAGDGKIYKVSGDLDTIMAGLACGEPSPIGWEVLKDFATGFMAIPDYIAARGMRILANPIGEDSKIIAGESGAVGLGLLSIIMESEELKTLKDYLELDKDSTILLFNTEGDTDPVNYRNILWDGKYPVP
ncbi:MAG TPA: diaminopropionate ammonia-lyase [Eubacteriaceae bacterium]|jgi:diaminopropionate ammonia-lyase|nr:diaminopropionate ammonia-lyase [Eubacteriaceae bacterium]